MTGLLDQWGRHYMYNFCVITRATIAIFPNMPMGGRNNSVSNLFINR